MDIKMNFWTRKSQKNSKGQIPIYLNISFNETKCQYSVGVYIRMSQWDKKAQRIKGSSEEVSSLNGKLTATKARALKVNNDLLMTREPFNLIRSDKIHIFNYGR